MKTLTTSVYSYKELSQSAKVTVLQAIANRADIDFAIEEMASSLKALVSACNLRLTNYSFGAYCRSYGVTVEDCNLEDVSGPRAIAWFARILKSHGYNITPRFKDMTFPGVCGFTGICYDEDCAQAVWDSLMDGNTVRKAFDAIGDRLCGICEKELEYAQSEECILDYLDQDQEIYDAEGNEI